MKDSAPKGKWGIQKLNPAQIPDSHLVQFLVRQQRPTFQRPATGVSWTHTHNNQTQKLKHTNRYSLTKKNTLTQITTNIFKQHPTFYVLESRVVDLHTSQKYFGDIWFSFALRFQLQFWYTEYLLVMPCLLVLPTILVRLPMTLIRALSMSPFNRWLTAG